MLFNHDFYKKYSDATHFTNIIDYPNIRDDQPTVFLAKSGNMPKVFVRATTEDAGLNGITFTNVANNGVRKFTYTDGVTYSMVYHLKDGGRSWDGYKAMKSMVTSPIDITGYERLTIRGSVITNNASLDYKVYIALSSDPMPDIVKNEVYDFSAWKAIVIGDHNVASTNTQVNYDLTMPISELTSKTSGEVYFSYAIEHGENISAYSIYTGIKDLFLSSTIEY